MDIGQYLRRVRDFRFDVVEKIVGCSHAYASPENENRSSEFLFLAGALTRVVAAVPTGLPNSLHNFAASDSCAPQFIQNAISPPADLCCQSASAYIHPPVIRRHNKKTCGLRPLSAENSCACTARGTNAAARAAARYLVCDLI